MDQKEKKEKNKISHEELTTQFVTETIECVRDIHNKHIDEFTNLLKFKDINQIYSAVKIILVNIDGTESEPKYICANPLNIKYVTELKKVVLSHTEIDQIKKKQKIDTSVSSSSSTREQSNKSLFDDDPENNFDFAVKDNKNL